MNGNNPNAHTAIPMPLQVVLAPIGRVAQTVAVHAGEISILLWSVGGAFARRLDDATIGNPQIAHLTVNPIGRVVDGSLGDFQRVSHVLVVLQEFSWVL